MVKSMDWRRWLSSAFILIGFFFLFGVTLFWVQTALAGQLITEKLYLVSTVGVDLPLPTFTATPSPIPSPTSTIKPTKEKLVEQTPSPTLIPTNEKTKNPNQGKVEKPKKKKPSPTPTQKPSAGPVIRIAIPTLNVDRVVMPVDFYTDANGQLQWNTNPLFATRNRQDLVGQLATSVNPRDGGNIVLVGHNYNEGWFAGAGVFVNISSLQPGNNIRIYTHNGKKFVYVVQFVKQVPWRHGNANELEKHQKYLWPTPKERLTLVTCGGANFWPWPARIYVVATPK